MDVWVQIVRKGEPLIVLWFGIVSGVPYFLRRVVIRVVSRAVILVKEPSLAPDMRVNVMALL